MPILGIPLIIDATISANAIGCVWIKILDAHFSFLLALMMGDSFGMLES